MGICNAEALQRPVGGGQLKSAFPYVFLVINYE